MNVTIDVRPVMAVAAALGDLPSRLGRTMATALTRTAQRVAEAERREIDDVFDRPVDFTRQAIYVSTAQAGSTRTRATQDDRGQPVIVNLGANLGPIQAEVGVKDTPIRGRAAIKWLNWHIYGGQRTAKAYERLLMRAGAMPDDMRSVPGRFAKLDAYGNLSRGQAVQILSQLRIDSYAGSTRALPRLAFADTGRERRAKQTRIRNAHRRAGGEFIAFPYGRGRLRAGIYRVRDTGWGRTAPQPVLLFVSKAQYEAERFDFFGVARKATQSHLPQEVGRALRETVARLQGNGSQNEKVTTA